MIYRSSCKFGVVSCEQNGMRHVFSVTFVLLIAVFPLFAQTGKPSVDVAPREVTYCQLSRDPAAYNHSLVRLTAFVTHGFEDFHLADPSCATQGFSVWVMYGGKAQSDTVYCCPGEGAAKTRSEPLTFEGLQIPLVDDSTFQQFAALLKKEQDTTVRVTALREILLGREADREWPHLLGRSGTPRLLQLVRNPACGVI